jgi:hypothetical protein
VQDGIKKYEERGYIDAQVAAKLYKEHQDEYEQACAALTGGNGKELALRVLRMYAIGIEKMHLKQLYHYHEVNERVFKRLTGKLQLQLESVEVGNLAPNMSIHSDGKDVFEHLATKLRNVIDPETETDKIDNLYLYYRAQSIISRKVLKELQAIDTDSAQHIFTAEALTHVLNLYTNFRNQSEKKMQEIAAEHPERYKALSQTLAQYGIQKVEEHTLTELFERELITPKLHVTLAEELR